MWMMKVQGNRTDAPDQQAGLVSNRGQGRALNGIYGVGFLTGNYHEELDIIHFKANYAKEIACKSV